MNYPAWWDKTITIYNKFEDPVTSLIKWYRHSVSDCFVKNEHTKLYIGNTTLESNVILCRIPKQDDFLARHEWIQKPNDEMGSYFTLGIGDIIVFAEVDDEISEYTPGHRASDVTEKYKNLQGCMNIESLTINTGPERCYEHYLVRGI